MRPADSPCASLARPRPWSRTRGALFVAAAAAALGWPSASARPATAAVERAEPDRLDVDEAVVEAIEHNLSFLADAYEVPIARAELLTARLRLNPVLSFGADHLDLLGTGYNRINGAGPQEFFVRTDLFFLGGRKRQRRLASAETGVAVAELDLRDAVRRLVLEVQRACVEVQSAAATVELAVTNRELFRRIVALNEIRVRSGDLARVDLARAQIAELQAANELRKALSAQTIARNRLMLLLGRRPTAILVVKGALRTGEVPLALTELHDKALRVRPDLLALRSRQTLTQAEIRRQIAEGKIDVSVGIEARRQQGLAGTGNSLGVFFGIPLRLFDRNQGQIERARQQALQVERRRAAIEREIRVEVENAYVDYQTARDLLTSFEGGMLQKAEQVLATAEYAYMRGEASLIELIDAQRAFNDTRRTYNEARAAFARSLYVIDAVTGRGLPP